jgi:excisionase family DNA binding protein
MHDTMLSIHEVARRLGVSPAIVYRAVRQRELTAIRAGVRRVVIEPAALERYLARRWRVARAESSS